LWLWVKGSLISLTLDIELYLVLLVILAMLSKRDISMNKLSVLDVNESVF